MPPIKCRSRCGKRSFRKLEIAQFPVVLDAKVSAGQGETHELSLLSHVDPQSLHLQKEGDHNLDTLTFIFGVFDQKENLVIAQQRHATVDVADGQLPEFLKTGMNVDMAFQLKPGSYRIREVVTDSEQRLTALSRNVDIPEVIPTPAPPAAASSRSPMPAGGEHSAPSCHHKLRHRLPHTRPGTSAGTPSSSDPATARLLVRVWDNFAQSLSSLPNVFADEHVVSSVSAPYSNPSKGGVYDSELESTIDSTIDSIFRLKRFSADGKTADLVESREIKYVDHHVRCQRSVPGRARHSGRGV